MATTPVMAGICEISSGSVYCDNVNIIDGRSKVRGDVKYWHINRDVVTKDGILINVYFSYSYMLTAHTSGGSRVTKELERVLGEVAANTTNKMILENGQGFIREVIETAEDGLYIDHRHFVVFKSAKRIKLIRID